MRVAAHIYTASLGDIEVAVYVWPDGHGELLMRPPLATWSPPEHMTHYLLDPLGSQHPAMEGTAMESDSMTEVTLTDEQMAALSDAIMVATEAYDLASRLVGSTEEGRRKMAVLREMAEVAPQVQGLTAHLR